VSNEKNRLYKELSISSGIFAESMDIFIPNDGQIGFATKDEPVFWNKISNEFVPRGTKVDKDKKPVVQLFSLCIYRFPIETCE